MRTHRLPFTFILGVFIATLTLTAQDVKKSVIANGGNVMNNDKIKAGITVGQTAIGPIQFDNQQASIGFWYSGLELVTSIKEIASELRVDRIFLSQNYPNPFSQVTYFDLHLVQSTQVRMEVFDMKGALVDVLIDEKLNEGHYTIKWEAGSLPSGSYIAKIRLDGRQNYTVNGVSKVDL